jgi:hypothetical protein
MADDKRIKEIEKILLAIKLKSSRIIGAEGEDCIIRLDYGIAFPVILGDDLERIKINTLDMLEMLSTKIIKDIEKVRNG